MDLGEGVHTCVRLAPNPRGSVSRPDTKGSGQKPHPKVLQVWKCPTEPSHHHSGPQRRLRRQRAHLNIKGGNLLLIGGRGQKIAHLGLEWVVHLHIDIIAGCLLLVIRVHTAGSAQEGEGTYTVCPSHLPGPTQHTPGQQETTPAASLWL